MAFFSKFITWVCSILIACNSIPKSFSSQNLTPSLSSSAKSAVPEEFYNLTIPYLRDRKYEGSSIELDTKINDNQFYSSWIATYNSDNLKIHGLLTIPSSEKPNDGYPAVVFVHGYIPPNDYVTTQKYVQYVDYLAKQGLVVFKIDLRGHGESEGQATGAYYSADYVIDVLNAYESLKKLNYVNPHKVGLWGHSMAGNVVFRSLIVHPEISRVVIWAGAVYTYKDMEDYGIQDGSYRPTQNPNSNRRQRLRDTVGPVSSSSAFWNNFIPTNFISDLDAKVQIHHAVNDSVVSIRYSRNLKEVLAEKGAQIDLFEYPTGGHNIESPSFETAIKRSADFLTE